MAKEIGYTRFVNCTFISNAKIIALGKYIDLFSVGVIQDIGYLRGVGWEDMGLGACTLRHAKLFTEVVKENSERKVISNSSAKL